MLVIAVEDVSDPLMRWAVASIFALYTPCFVCATARPDDTFQESRSLPLLLGNVGRRPCDTRAVADYASSSSGARGLQLTFGLALLLDYGFAMSQIASANHRSGV